MQLRHLTGGVEETKTMLTPDEVRRGNLDETQKILNGGAFDVDRYDQELSGYRACIFDPGGTKRLGMVRFTLPVNSIFPGQDVNPRLVVALNLSATDNSAARLTNVAGRFDTSDFEPTGVKVGEVSQLVTFYTTQATKTDQPDAGSYTWPISIQGNGHVSDPTFGTATVKCLPKLITMVESVEPRSGGDSVPKDGSSGF